MAYTGTVDKTASGRQVRLVLCSQEQLPPHHPHRRCVRGCHTPSTTALLRCLEARRVVVVVAMHSLPAIGASNHALVACPRLPHAQYKIKDMAEAVSGGAGARRGGC